MCNGGDVRFTDWIGDQLFGSCRIKKGPKEAELNRAAIHPLLPFPAAGLGGKLPRLIFGIEGQIACVDCLVQLDRR